MTKIAATLPHKIIKGNIKQRYQKIKAANSQLFAEIMQNPEDLSFARLTKLTQDSFVPECGRRINVKVGNTKQSGVAGLADTVFKDGKPHGYEIKIGGSNPEAMSPANLSEFMHQVTHVHHQLFEPKLMSTISSLDLTDQQAARINKFYSNVFNTNHPFEYFNELGAKLRMKLALRGLGDDEKLKVLHLMRNNMQMERLALVESEKYSVKLRSAGIEQNPIFYVEEFLFEEKIDFLKHQIHKQIKKMRKK